MSTISGLAIRRNKRMNHWYSIVEEWVLAHERFARFSPNDAAYWYTERTNIGILAGAAWRCGLVALEEFQTTKDNRLSAKKADQKVWKGRCDLWLAQGSHEEVVEAKYCAKSMRSNGIADTAANALERAVQDARHSRWKADMLATGIVFMPIYSNVRLSESSEVMTESINAVVAQLSKVDKTMIAWCFPDATRGLISPNTKNYWPGLVMLGRSEQ